MEKWADVPTVFLAAFVSAQRRAYEQYVGAPLLGVKVFRGPPARVLRGSSSFCIVDVGAYKRS